MNLTKEQEKELLKVRRSFVKKYGERKWISLLKYSDVMWLTPIKIGKLLTIDRFKIRYWLKRIKRIKNFAQNTQKK